MAVKAEVIRFLSFTCEHCNKPQCPGDSLEPGFFEGRPVRKDRIDCEYCGRENYVYLESE